MTFLKNTLWSATGSMALTLGRMSILVILARRLGPASFGTLAFAQWLTDISITVCTFGLQGVATRYFPQTLSDGSEKLSGLHFIYTKLSFLAILLSSAVSTSLTLALIQPAAYLDVLAILAFNATSAYWALSVARANGLFLFRRLAASSVTFVSLATLGLLLTAAPGGLFQVFMVLATANLAAALPLSWGTLRGPRAGMNTTLPEDLTREIKRYAGNTWITTLIASFVWSKGELPLVKAVATTSILGYYSIGLTLSGIVNQGLNLLTGALGPQISKLWDENNTSQLSWFSAVTTNLLLLGAGLAVGFIICFAQPLIRALFGSDYLPAADLAAILSVGVLGLISGPAHLVLQAATGGAFSRNITILAVVLLLGLGLALLPYFGIPGVAFARSTTQIAVALATLVYVLRVPDRTVIFRRHVLAFLALLAMASSLLVLRSWWPSPSLPTMIAVYLVYATTIFGISIPGWPTGFGKDLRALAKFGGS